jgi:hypothetical protein
MGGADPPTSLSQAVFPPQKICQLGETGSFGWHGPPQMAPLILGLLGFAREYSWSLVTDFYRFIWTFLGDYS